MPRDYYARVEETRAGRYTSPMIWSVAALYKFIPLGNLPALRTEIQSCCVKNGICGTILVAPEGLNGTVGGPEAGIKNLIDFLDEKAGIRGGEVKYSTAREKPFRRLKVRIKKEIVTLRQPEADPSKLAGTYASPEEWNALLADPDVTVLDTRNRYETGIGMFKGALDPQTDYFTQLPDFIGKHLDPKKQKKIAMYCTGGIRCEKASAYMRAQGFEEVYHLKGGILKYLETMSADQSLWEGECFVFDRRVALGHGLEEGGHSICHGCRHPLSTEDCEQPSYEEGVSCPHCKASLTPERIASLRMRHRQMTADGTDTP